MLGLKGIQAAMARDGALALRGLFPRAMLERMRREVMRRFEKGELRRNGLVRDIAGRFTAALPFEGPFLDPKFYADAKVLDIMAALLGSSYCIGSLETVIAMPGAYEQHLHVDGPLRFDRRIGKRRQGYAKDLSGLPPYAVTLCVPLCDIDEDNGPTAIYKGSHRTALSPRVPTEAQVKKRFQVEYMTGKIGDCFLFDYRVFHGGMPNYTPEPRAVLMLVFTRTWFRDPNLMEVYPSVVIRERDLRKVPGRHRGLFMLAPAARRPLWRV